MAYSRDTEVELKGTFTRVSDGALVDPDDVTLEVRNPAGTVTDYTLGASQVTRASLGVFTYLVLLDASGTWFYRFKGTGAVKVADWKPLNVIDDPLN